MKYYQTQDINIIECSPEEFSIKMVNQNKRNCNYTSYVNAGFFGTYHENGAAFTLPAAHLVCDFDTNDQYVTKYCQERGKFKDNKFIFDASLFSYNNEFYKKSVTTLVIKNNIPSIVELVKIETDYQYAISGVPIIRDGVDVSYNSFVLKQGWNSSSLYSTEHIFIGLKPNNNNIFIMGYKSTTNNLSSTSEGYNKFSALGFNNVIKLDGGGSAYMKYNNNIIKNTSENRLINNIIVVMNNEVNKNESNNENKCSDWASTSWEKAYNKSILDGTNPKSTLTREQLATVLDRLKLL